ncbi:MAG: biotin-dependent carboxyltransferase [Planctomycetes bacterium]|nr:biotin-dependent carboxyltransferase [Planctomycetota bacterium]
MTLRVLDPGLATFLVDFGRPGSRSLGVPLGGAADRFSLAIGNALVGNPPDAAALEISLAGPTLQAEVSLACVLFGAPFDLLGNNQRLAMGKTFTLHPGEEVHIGGARAGVRAYLCVRGGLQAPVILGSRSALEPLHAGAELACLPGSMHARWVRLPWSGGAELRPGDDLPAAPGPVQTLSVLDGPQADWFEPEEWFAQSYQVTPAADRMGLRLAGRPLRLPSRELVSEPVCPGSVQVANDGQCMILGVDGQTIGGYPKIAQVISADLDRLGQLRPGDRVAFSRVSLAEAEALYRRQQAHLREWVLRLQCTV